MELDQSHVDIVAHDAPEDFYRELRRLIGGAKEHLVISALYLGSGEKEQDLLNDITSALEKNDKLSVLVILDHSRARRGEKSSIDLLSPLVDKFSSRIQVCFYQMPQLTKPPYAWLPYWVQEIVAVYHCKYCVSDENVLITGANLSNDYFTDRQDRYWTIYHKESSPPSPLARHLQDFSKAVAADSWSLSSSSLNRQLLPPTVNTQPALLTFLQQHPLHLATSATSKNSENPHSQIQDGKLVAFPIVQHEALQINQENDFLLRILQPTKKQSLSYFLPEVLLSDMALQKVQLCTPYTNFPSVLCQVLADLSSLKSKSPVHVQIIGPAPHCHGFATGKGFKAELPYLHESNLFSSLFPLLRNKNNTPQNSHLMEWRQYDRTGWTMHRKGLWLGYERKNDYESCESRDEEKEKLKEEEENESMQWATYIGSSNFGERSWRRDLELGFFFLEKNNAKTNNNGKLQRILQAETKDLVTSSHCYQSLSTSLVPQTKSEPSHSTSSHVSFSSSNHSRAHRLHIRALAWLIRSVL